jgi:DNA replication protein DnaC
MENLKSIMNRLPSAVSNVPSRSDYKCNACLDQGWVDVDGKGFQMCECRKAEQLARWLSKIPPIYRQFRFEDIQPDAGRHPKQAQVLEMIRADPTASLMLCGRNGSGKSLFGWMLYRRAIEEHRPAVGMHLTDLLAQFRRFELDGDSLPSVRAEDLREDQRRWLIFLDEFEKARPSEFSSEQLYLLVDAIYSFRHQIVIASNLTDADLCAHWSRVNESYGYSIFRRIYELEGFKLVEMF